MTDQSNIPCPEGHQWHDVATGRICAACLAEAPAEQSMPEPLDDPKRVPQTTDLRRPLRFVRAWVCYWLVMLLPWWRTKPDSALDRLHFWLLPWAGDWAYAEDQRAIGRDPWGDRRRWTDGPAAATVAPEPPV